MNARERLHQMIHTSEDSRTVWAEDEATAALDAYSAEVLAAGAAMLRRQSRHHLNRPHFNAGLRQGAVLLDRLTTRGADSVNDEDFYQPGYVYSYPRYADGYDWKFRCDGITTHPENGERIALGWRFFKGQWGEYAYTEDSWDIHNCDPAGALITTPVEAVAGE